MSRRPARCTEADLKRAVKVAGEHRTVRVLPDGTIELAPIRPQEREGDGLPDEKVIVF